MKSKQNTLSLFIVAENGGLSVLWEYWYICSSSLPFFSSPLVWRPNLPANPATRKPPKATRVHKPRVLHTINA
ncbi:MAG: hypothetical protein QXZ70_05390 [Candidatus Bathyarchaeia archaeon]